MTKQTLPPPHPREEADAAEGAIRAVHASDTNDPRCAGIDELPIYGVPSIAYPRIETAGRLRVARDCPVGGIWKPRSLCNPRLARRDRKRSATL